MKIGYSTYIYIYEPSVSLITQLLGQTLTHTNKRIESQAENERGRAGKGSGTSERETNGSSVLLLRADHSYWKRLLQ